MMIGMSFFTWIHEANTMISGSPGITRKMLIRRLNSSSTHPPKKPAHIPTRMLKAVAIRPMANPSARVGRAPLIICRKISWLRWSVPSQCAAEGACIGAAVKSEADGSPVQTSGAKMATRIKKARRPSPTAALRLRAIRASHSGIPRRSVRRTRNGAAGAGAPPPGPSSPSASSVIGCRCIVGSSSAGKVRRRARAGRGVCTGDR